MGDLAFVIPNTHYEYQVKNLIREDFRHYIDFNVLLIETGAILTGSYVLKAILNRDETFESRNIDIVVDITQYYKIEKFLITNEGYDFLSLDIHVPPKRKWMMKKLYHHTKGEKKDINIHVVISRTPVEHVENFDLTCLMNYYDGKNVYMLRNAEILTVHKKSFYKYNEEYNEEFLCTNDANSGYPSGSEMMQRRIAKYESCGISIIEVYFENATVRDELQRLCDDKVKATGNLSNPVNNVETVPTTFQQYSSTLKKKKIEVTVAEMICSFNNMIARNETRVLLTHPIGNSLYKTAVEQFLHKIGWPQGTVVVERTSEDNVCISIDMDKCYPCLETIE